VYENVNLIIIYMIKVENLNFKYKKNKNQALKNINFEINKGEIFGFLGPSGAGKSTTQKILIKVLNNFSGNINILNKPLQNLSSDFYNNIGVGFELPNHYLKLTGKENLSLFASFYDKKTIPPEVLLQMVGLENDADKKVENYSKGMKMRLNFVRSLMHSPEIYFFDEPTSGLDPTNARNLKDIILDLKSKGKTIFLTTHNMHDADELCDRVAFINDGEISTIDSPKELKLKYGKRKVKIEYLNHSIKTEEFDMDTLSSNENFFSILKNEKIRSIHSEEATLEDIFIKITGQKLV